MSHSKSELEKQLAEAEKWCKHFDEEGCFNTVWHDKAARLRGAIKAFKGKTPKPVTKRADIGPEEEKENGT